MPKRVGDMRGCVGVRGAHVVGNVAYLASTDGLSIVDFGDPRNPALLDEAPVGDFNLSVQVVGHLGFVTSLDSGLHIFGLDSPTHPVPLGRYSLNAYETQVVGTRAYVASGSGLWILDVADPASPRGIGHYDTPVIGVQVVGNTAYLNAGQGGLHIVDVGDPAVPRLVNTPGANHAYKIRVVEHRGYLASGSLIVLDLTIPANPTLLGSFAGTDIRDVEIAGNLALVADRETGLHVLDISFPSSPIRIGGDRSRGTHSVWIEGNLACVSDANTGLRVFDLGELRRAPVIWAGREGPRRHLQLKGQSGSRYVLEEVGSLGGPSNWIQIGEVVLTNDTQKVPLPVAQGGTQTFYRARLSP